MSEAASAHAHAHRQDSASAGGKSSALRLSALERMGFVALLVAALWGGVYWALR